MRSIHYDIVTEKMFSKKMIGLVLAGIAVNVCLTRLVSMLGLPLYMDNVGSILVAVIAGPVPGMTVGFLSNLLSFLHDPGALYFGVLTILIAYVAGKMSQEGFFKKVSGKILAIMSFMLIGGAAGSVIGWFLYGGVVGQTVSAPFSLWFYARGFSAFWAQFTGDMVADALDKTLSVLLVVCFLKHYPKRLYDAFPLSYLYDRSETEIKKVTKEQKQYYQKRSIFTKIIRILSLSMLLLSVLSTLIGGIYYWKTKQRQYIQKTENIAVIAARMVNGNQVMAYKQGKRDSWEYRQSRMHLKNILESVKEVSGLYVYSFQEDGCYVLYDFDTKQRKAFLLNSVISYDPSIARYKDRLLLGSNIKATLRHGQDGWFFAAYAPIKDNNGKTEAYAIAEIPAQKYVQSILTFIMQMLSVEFGIYVLVIVWAMFLVQKKLVEPVNALIRQSLAFDETEVTGWLSSSAWKKRKTPGTKDEIETLYDTICAEEANVARAALKIEESDKKLQQTTRLENKNKELTKAVLSADNRNEMKTEFYSRMSHDMRTPMNGIIGLVELSKDEDNPAILRENLQKIGTAGNYLLGLINDTLDISKLESHKMELSEEPVYGKQFLEELLDMVRLSAEEKNIALHVQNESMRLNVYVWMDKLRLQQVFMNLISNAIKFTPEGGKIDLILQLRNEENGILHDRFVLQDNGIGMSKKFIENGLFVPFSQEHNELSSAYAGTGLGLSIAKYLVELMGGNITARSELGEGTSFTIDLDFKLTDEKGNENGTPKVRDEEVFPLLEGKKILLAEDNELNAEIATHLLEHVGMHVTWKEDGKQAMDCFEEKPAHFFDAILMDIRMPVMDGLTATRRIRAMKKSDAKTIPIIAMTANAYSEDKKKTKEAGMNEHLAKPIDVHRLYSVLAQYMK